jgi:hypothetical protein
VPKLGKIKPNSLPLKSDLTKPYLSSAFNLADFNKNLLHPCFRIIVIRAIKSIPNLTDIRVADLNFKVID